MKQRLDHYKATITKDGGAMERTYPGTPTNAQVPCMAQPAMSEVVTDYGRHDEVVTLCIYFLDSTLFETVNKEDKIVVEGNSYEVMGSKNLAGVGRVYRLDVRNEVQ